MKYAGIDYSMSSPAICVYDTETDVHTFYAFYQKKKQCSVDPRVVMTQYPLYTHDIERYLKLAAWTLNIIQGCDYVWMEGYAFAGSGSVFNIAENTGIMKSALYDCNIKFETIPPTTVKKMATGKGNATKTDMYESFIKATGIMLGDVIGNPIDNVLKLPAPVTDIVDAYWVLRCGLSKRAELVTVGEL